MSLDDIAEEASDEPLFSSEHPAIPSVTVISTSDGQEHELSEVEDFEGVQSHPSKSGNTN
jgi:hypothetical protein